MYIHCLLYIWFTSSSKLSYIESNSDILVFEEEPFLFVIKISLITDWTTHEKQNLIMHKVYKNEWLMFDKLFVFITMMYLVILEIKSWIKYLN